MTVMMFCSTNDHNGGCDLRQRKTLITVENVLLEKISVGFPLHGQPLNCQAGPCTNTATTRSLHIQVSCWEKTLPNTVSLCTCRYNVDSKHFQHKHCHHMLPAHIIITQQVCEPSAMFTENTTDTATTLKTQQIHSHLTASHSHALYVPGKLYRHMQSSDS